jgi:hypothetical protein
VRGNIERNGRVYATLNTFVPVRLVIDPDSMLGSVLLSREDRWQEGMEMVVMQMLRLGNEGSAHSVDAEALIRNEWRDGL